MKIEDRFLKYVSFDTQSDPTSNTAPSSKKQLELGKYLVEDMKNIGIKNAELNEYGIVYGSIPANDDKGKVIGFIAHMDTAPAASGANIKPNIVNNYQGGKITLNEEKDLYLDPKEFNCLNTVIGHDLMTTDGTTLLGADDKAGVTIIMQMAEYLLAHPEIKHNEIKIAFTPDEEVGRGTENFDVDKFGAEYAYTVDGGDIRGVEYENFNAFEAVVTVNGKSVHPGTAKNTMINSILVAQEFHSMLPVHARPEATDGYEGFNHLDEIKGNCEKTVMEYIIRNHDLKLAEKQCQDFLDIKEYLNKKYGYSIIDVEIKQQYRNMKEIIDQHRDIIDMAEGALKACGIEPKAEPIRGGTDGASLTYKGLPCPNLGTGGFNFHGPFEFVSLTMMRKQVEVLLKIVELNK
ncbi:MAG: peptidase T [Bacilli bacterium]|nr:peptidase T [Bacilli bacterium]